DFRGKDNDGDPPTLRRPDQPLSPLLAQVAREDEENRVAGYIRERLPRGEQLDGPASGLEARAQPHRRLEIVRCDDDRLTHPTSPPRRWYGVIAACLPACRTEV